MLLGDFGEVYAKSCFWGSGKSRAGAKVLGNQAEFFAELNGLGTAAGAKLIEDAAGVRLDGVFADEEFLGDIAVAHALGDQLEDFKFAWRDGELILLGGVQGEWAGGGGDFADGFVDNYALARELESEPDTECGKDGGDQGGVEFDRMLDDEEAILRPLEKGDEQAADDAEDEDVFFHAGLVWTIRYPRLAPKEGAKLHPNEPKKGSPGPPGLGHPALHPGRAWRDRTGRGRPAPHTRAITLAGHLL